MNLLKPNTRLIVSSEFYSDDSEELFKKNLKNQPENWYWRNKPIWYNVNKSGYRCPEFDNIDWSNSTLIIGDSWVFGVGLDENSTICNQLSDLIHEPVINLGQAGASPMQSWANTCILIDNNVKPKNVIYLWNFAHRVVEFQPNRLDYTSISHMPATYEKYGHGFGLSWITHDYQAFEYLKYAITSVSNMWNCKVLNYCFSFDNLDKKYSNLRNTTWLPNPETFGWARDYDEKARMAHPGPGWNKKWASIIAKDLGSNS